MWVQTTGLVALTILAYSRYKVCLTMDPSVCSYIGIYIDSLPPLCCYSVETIVTLVQLDY